MRTTYNCQLVNEPKTIFGIEWKLVIVVGAFFTFAAIVFKVLYILIAPVAIVAFLRGPGRKDSMFLRVHIRHRNQRDRYTPAYVALPNLRTPRPMGFGKTNWF